MYSKRDFSCSLGNNVVLLFHFSRLTQVGLEVSKVSVTFRIRGAGNGSREVYKVVLVLVWLKEVNEVVVVTVETGTGMKHARTGTSFFFCPSRCLSAGLRYLRLARLPRHDRGPVLGGNRSAASCPCTVLTRASYHHATRSPVQGQGPAWIPQQQTFCSRMPKRVYRVLVVRAYLPDLFPSPCQGTKCPSCCVRSLSRQQCRSKSAPHPCHAVKDTQTIPNNIVLWQRWATSSWRLNQ